MIKREGTRYVWGGEGAIGLSMYGIPHCMYTAVEKRTTFGRGRRGIRVRRCFLRSLYVGTVVLNSVST
jgi:hypothetical protein